MSSVSELRKKFENMGKSQETTPPIKPLPQKLKTFEPKKEEQQPNIYLPQ